jgi:hypothetical protein
MNLRHPLGLAIMALLALLGPTLLSGCVVPAEPVVVGEVVTSVPPPPQRYEVAPAAPGPAKIYVWRPGHW